MSGTAWMRQIWSRSSDEILDAGDILSDIVDRANAYGWHNIAAQTKTLIEKLQEVSSTLDAIDAWIGGYTVEGTLAHAWRMMDYMIAGDVSINAAKEANDALDKERYAIAPNVLSAFCHEFTHGPFHTLEQAMQTNPRIKYSTIVRLKRDHDAVDFLHAWDGDKWVERPTTANYSST